MAKATLEFDLNDQDDVMAHLRAVKSLDMALALWQFAYNTKKKLQSQIEYDEEAGTNISSYDVVDKVFETFWDIMKDHNICLDELIV